ncbi:hypothetical protein EEL31_10360 [Brevibacillus laterosporus]|nr:phage tail spike protein [Brevibacillus laterosporus]TPG68891.1 hypothetical protein EEL31_10360 [Brevibacillus laterosporus]
MQMGEIDFGKKPVQPEIFLAKPNRQIIAKLTEAHNIVFTSRLGSLNEITFDIPYERDIHHHIQPNPNLDHLRHRFLLKFVKGFYEEWFIIDSPTDSMSDEGDVKQIHAYSLGYELTDKMIRDYKEISKNASEVLLDALRSTIWNIGYIDAEFDLKFRSFEISSTTVLDFVYEIATTFNALVVWDTKKRQINLYKHENIGGNKGLKFSYGRYLKTLEKEIQPDEMVTRLKVFGKDNLSIQRVNPTGSNYIENFGYFMFPFFRDDKKNVTSHSHYMSDDLCHAILDYVKLVEDSKDEFKKYLTEKEGHQKTLLDGKSKLLKLENELQVILDNLFVAQTTLQPDEFYQAQKDSKLRDIANQQAVIKGIENFITVVDSKINTLKIKLSIEKNFTPELIKERNQYIIEKEWVNEQIIDDKDLYDAGIKVFEEFAKPKTVINMDVVNFFEIVEEQRNWDKLNLGDTVTIQYEKLGVNVTAKITEMEFNFEDANIKLTIANVNDIESNEDKFIKSLYKSISTSTKVDMSKYKWDKYEHDLGDVSKIIQNMYDYVKDQLTMAFNETVIIDRSGITIIDPNDPLTFLRATHGCLAITNDGGNTYKHAITGIGIVGERIYGRIITGERVVVGDPDGILEIRGNKMVITDRNQREVMWFGLYDTKPDRFGVKLENDINQVIMDRDDGFTINRKKGTEWHKILWLDTQGIIHSEGLVTKNIKIFSDKNEILLDAEAGIIDLRPINGHLGQNITLSTKDGICVTRGNDLNRIWLNADLGIAIEKKKEGRWFKTFYVDLDGKLVAEELVAKKLTIVNARDEILLDEDALNFDFTTLDSIILDDVIISSEKVTLLNQVRSLQQTYQTLLSQIDTYLGKVFTDREKSYPELDKAKLTLETAKNNLVTKYNRLISYVTPVFIDMNKSTSIIQDMHSNRTEFYQVFKDYHDAATSARNSLENFLEKSSLQLGRDYNNVVIDAENGITVTRGDNLVKTTLNATEGIKIERKEGGSWEKKFYVDTNGILYAEDLVAKRLILLGGESGEDLIIDANTKFMDLNQFDKIVGNIQAENITAKVITADEGFIADLCVNQLKTINPSAETGTRNYIHIHDQYIKWITGQATGSTQATNRNGDLLYWLDSDRSSTTIEDTGYPVEAYTYDELTKMQIYFNGDDPSAYPIIEMGAGSGNGQAEKAWIYKDTDKFAIDYYTSSSSGQGKRSIVLSNDEINISSNVGAAQTSLKMTNSEIEIKLQGSGMSSIKMESNGNIKLQSLSGSYIELGRDVRIVSAGNLYLN